MARQKKTSIARRSPDPLSYEQAIEELEAIVKRIEEGEVGLEESLDEYRRGVELIKQCRAILDTAEQKVRTLQAETSTQEPDVSPDDESTD